MLEVLLFWMEQDIFDLTQILTTKLLALCYWLTQATTFGYKMVQLKGDSKILISCINDLFDTH